VITHLFSKNADVYSIHRHFFIRKGRAMNKTAKDMSKVYRNTSTIDLIKNKGKKLRQLHKAQEYNTYFAKKDRARLQHMIDQIDVELAARAAQEPLF